MHAEITHNLIHQMPDGGIFINPLTSEGVADAIEQALAQPPVMFDRLIDGEEGWLITCKGHTVKLIKVQRDKLN